MAFINAESITPNNPENMWDSRSFDNRMTYLKEDEMAYSLTEDSLRRPLMTEM